MSTALECGDAELVEQSRAGDQAAFGRIVARYQSLVCSLAYNATGSLSRSEDLAQETFVIAWIRLHTLREPDRLCSWLCGIARNLAHDRLRKQGHEPVCSAQPLEMAQEVPSPELPPSEQAIRREEEAILWRSIERIPALYREPLILFYREHQSVERVAAALELSEDAVKQRLARGRKMLHEEVAVFVEGTLRRTAPGKAFTVGVLAALPLLGTNSATAAAAAGAIAKAGLGAKGATAAGLVGAALGPLLGLLGGAFGAWSSIKNTRSPRERQFMIRQTWYVAAAVLLFMAAVFALVRLGKPLTASSPILRDYAIGVLLLGYVLGLCAWVQKSNRRQRQIQIEDGTAAPMPMAQPRLVSRKQQLWNVYGSLGGSSAGALAWIVIATLRSSEWITASLTVLFGLGVVLWGGRALMRRPGGGLRVMVQIVVLLGLFTLVVCLLHRRAPSWAEAAGGLQATCGLVVVLGCGLAALLVLVGGFIWLKHKRVRVKGDGRAPHNLLSMILIPLIAGSAVCAAEVDRKPEPAAVARLRDRVAAREPFVLSLDARGPCVLAATEAASRQYREAIDEARKLHPSAGEVVFAPGNLEAVQEVFHRRRPRYAMVFILPDELDVNFAWKWLRLAAGWDENHFVHVRTGFITGQNPAAALAFVHRIRAAVENKTPLGGLAVDNFGPNAMAGKGAYYENAGDFMIPVLAERMGLSTISHGPSAFGPERSGCLDGAGIVHFGGHGYPDGIVDGLSAAQARDLKLGPCIVFNGACYTGVTGRWFDMRDKVVERHVASDASFCLAMLANNVLAYFAALHPDHGLPVYQEME
ncbi:MAG: RNA polymerase sigma factor, partial [Limisphaerales bacterium]